MVPPPHALGQGNAQARTKKQIAKSDDQKIKRTATEIVRGLATEYNLLLTSTSPDRKILMNELITPGSGRIFLNDAVIIENDFYDSHVKNLKKQDRDLVVEDYFEQMARKYGMDDNEEGPNKGKQVIISDVTTSNVKANSTEDPLYIKVLFNISYDAVARNNFKFETKQRLAQIYLEKQGKNWSAYISSIRFYDHAVDNMDDKTGNVIVVEDRVIKDLKFENVSLSSDTMKTINRNPVLRAFRINEFWGLLIDEDQSKKILQSPKFDDIGDFSQDGLAPVCLDGNWGYINIEGQIKIECKYALADPFLNGRARVQVGSKFRTIDTNGKEFR